MHVVDLGVGVTQRDWSDDFVAVWLPRLREGASGRLAGGSELPKPGALDERDELRLALWAASSRRPSRARALELTQTPSRSWHAQFSRACFSAR